MHMPLQCRLLAVGARALALLSLVGLGGCGCTLVGCANALRVQFTTAPSAPFSVELLSLSATEPAVDRVDCPQVNSCNTDVYFYGASVSQATIRVITTAGARDSKFADIRYTKSYPNGKECGPTCLNASVTAAIP
jgi:hypothetical protein